MMTPREPSGLLLRTTHSIINHHLHRSPYSAGNKRRDSNYVRRTCWTNPTSFSNRSLG